MNKIKRPKKSEYCKKKTKDKSIFFYSNVEENLDVKSREVYNTKPLEIHYPFSRDGKQKYKYIESIEFDGISPEVIKGVYKSLNFGLGFTRNLSPIIYELEKLPNINRIVISAKKNSKINKFNVIFNYKDLGSIFHTLEPFRKEQSSSLKKVSNNELSRLFSKNFKYLGKSYNKNDLSIYIKINKISSKKLSSSDVDSIVNLIPEKVKENSLLYTVDEKINHIKLEKIKNDFKKLINQKLDTKVFENKCQAFFQKNSWIFSSILSLPVSILKGKAYVGGKIYENIGGREADFLYTNNLTKNVFIIEIKTPLKKLFDQKKPYRKPDVFSISKELTGGIVQVFDQKDNLQKEFYKLSEGKFKSFNPKCILLIGKIKGLSAEKLKSLELFRNNLSNIDIITFDEMFNRTKLILGEFVSKFKK